MFSAKHFEIVTNAKWCVDGIEKTLERSQIDSILADLPCKYAYILHDKDTHETGEPKTPHWHIYVNFGRNSWKSSYLASRFGVAENFVGKVKGRSGDMLAYLTHGNAPEKYQYPEEDVSTNFEWIKERDKSLSSKNKKQRGLEILEGIVSGEIRQYNVTEYITGEEFHIHKKLIQDAFEYRTNQIKGVNRNMTCIYIWGDSGTGKTTYAKKLAQDKNYSTFVSSGSNDPLDDYRGEDCIILDDIRPSCMKLSDLLKMLDNNTASSVSSRYRNKVLECKMIILTSTLPVDSFFGQVFESEKETAVQLQRRCKTVIKMTSESIIVSQWMEKSRRYYAFPPIKNIVLEEFRLSDPTEDQMLDMLADTLGDVANYIREVASVSSSGEFTQMSVDDNELPDAWRI